MGEFTVEDFVSVDESRDLAEGLFGTRSRMMRGTAGKTSSGTEAGRGGEERGERRTLSARKSGCLWAPVVRSTGMISKSRPFSLSTVATRTTLGDTGMPYSFSGAISSRW